MSDVLHVEGTKALVAALTKKKPIAALLAELEIDPKRPPEWLVFNYKTSLDIVVHLAAPAFFAEGADEDEFWSEPPRDQIVFAKTGKCQKVTTEGETSDVKAKLADVTAYDVGGFLLQNITWIDAPPKSFNDADKLFRTAGDAYQGDLTRTPRFPRQQVAPAGGVSGTGFLGGARRTGAFTAQAPRRHRASNQRSNGTPRRTAATSGVATWCSSTA